ncbi:hypothetical protein KEM54_006700 [Ascosphaera aggregata]|nr:hypothetical protein KEM54_006700 [Ascosphaera aggregata]
MGKTKKARVPFYNHHDNPARKKAKQQQLLQQRKKAVSVNRKQQKKMLPPVVPFRRSDRILLIGEDQLTILFILGDFSFATSLINHHGCKSVLATCYDQEDILYEKYPQARKNVQNIVSARTKRSDDCSPVEIGIGTKRKRDHNDEQDDADEGTSPVDTEKEKEKQPIESAKRETPSNIIINNNSSNNHDKQKKQIQRLESLPNVLFGIDARKLGSGLAGGAKTIRNGFPRPPQRFDRQQRQQQREDGPKGGPWDVICFHFPHVGGLSKDVNRQVRANQDLLVSFFKMSLPLLSAPPPEQSADEESEDADYEFDIAGSEEGKVGDEEEGVRVGQQKTSTKEAKTKIRKEPGQILVTLFVGEPYTLWNIRDLARHAGLRVVTSFNFPWASYPGYSHARTIGEIEGKHGGRGGWRGEDREARTYVFERKEWEALTHSKKSPKKKRKNDDDDDDD